MLIEQRAPAPLRRRAAAGLVLSLAAVGVVVGVFLASPVAGEATRGDVHLRLGVLTALCVVPLAAALVDRRVDLLSPLVLVSAAFLFLYAIRGWAIDGDRQAGDDVTFRVATAYPNYAVPALDLAIVSLIAFYAGYLWRLGGDVGRALPRPRPPVRTRDWARAGWILTGVGLVCFALSPAAAYGYLSGTGLSEPLLNAAGLAPIGFAFLVLANRNREAASRRRVSWGLAAIAGVMFGSGMIFAHKATVIWAMFTVACAYHYGLRHLRPWQVLGAFLAFALIAFPAAQTLREVRSDDDSPSYLTALVRTPERLVTHEIGRPQRRSDGFTPGAYVSDAAAAMTRRLSGTDSLIVARGLTPAHHPFLDGRTYGRIPATFVPRAVWRDKPEVSLGGWFAVNYWGRIGSSDQSSQSIGLVGELYLNFGAGAVFLGMFLFGLLCRTWYAYLARAWTPAAIGLYVVSLPSIVQVEGDAGLLLRTGVSRVGFAAVAVFVVGWGLRRWAGFQRLRVDP